MENPSPVTPTRVYLEQGWIIAAGGGHCAPTSPCAGDGGRTPPPLLPQPGEIATATLGCGGTAHAAGGEGDGGDGWEEGAAGRWASSLQQNGSRLFLPLFSMGGCRGIYPKGPSPQIRPCPPGDRRDSALGSALTPW